jgi:hypothetical protein
MSEEQGNNPIARAKNLLGPSSNDASIEDILDQLLRFRTTCHPDRFTDPIAKKAGEQQFKEAQELITELNALHEQQIVKASGRDLATQRDGLDTLSMRLRLTAAEVEIAALKGTIAEMQKEASAEDTARRVKELAEIKKLYEPSKHRLVGAAIAILLTGALGVLSQFENVASQLERIWPGAPRTTRVVLFALALIILMTTLLRWLQHTEFRAMLGRVCTTGFAQYFLQGKDEYYWRHGMRTCFNEDQVVKFLEKDFAQKNDVPNIEIKFLPKTVCRLSARAWWLLTHPRVVYRWILGLLNHESYNHLKDAFIYWLIQRRLIVNPRAISLVHVFDIKGDEDEEK